MGKAGIFGAVAGSTPWSLDGATDLVTAWSTISQYGGARHRWVKTAKGGFVSAKYALSLATNVYCRWLTLQLRSRNVRNSKFGAKHDRTELLRMAANLLNVSQQIGTLDPEDRRSLVREMQ